MLFSHPGISIERWGNTEDRQFPRNKTWNVLVGLKRYWYKTTTGREVEKRGIPPYQQRFKVRGYYRDTIGTLYKPIKFQFDYKSVVSQPVSGYHLSSITEFRKYCEKMSIIFTLKEPECYRERWLSNNNCINKLKFEAAGSLGAI